ncbi:MAG: hypothetical protein AAF492_11005, partial [Verrucomicrobiota bacterium]
GDAWALDAKFFETPGIPFVENLPPTLGSDMADLNGEFVSGSRGFVTLYYGTSDGGTDPSLWGTTQSLGNVTNQTFSFTASNLLFGVPYYYRYFATNALGTNWASTTTVFKTRSPNFTTEGLTAYQYDTINGVALLNPIRNLQIATPNGSSIQVDDISYDGNFVTEFPFITAGDTFTVRWEGFFFPQSGPGVYTFGTRHDDHAMVGIDLNGDGDFDDGSVYDPGELVMDGGIFSGTGCCGTQFGQVNITERRPYRIVIVLEEAGGLEFIDAKWGPGTNNNMAALQFVNGTSGDFFADISGVINISNAPPTLITTTSAVLNASYIGLDALYDVTVFWGPTNAGTDVFGWSNSFNVGLFTNSPLTNLSHFANNLESNTTYYYSFRITNRVDTFWGTPVEFMTVGPPVVENTAPVSDIGEADLNGVLLGGGEADVTIYWGPNDGATNPAAWAFAEPLSNVINGVFSQHVTNLLFGLPYYYRAFATNDAGSDWANATTNFKTASPRFSGPAGMTVFTYDTTFGAGNLDPIANLLAITPSGTHNYNRPVFDYNGFGDFQLDYPTLTDANQFSVLWQGVVDLTRAPVGNYTFGTASDDGSMVYIDLNHDGDYIDPGELVVANNGNHGRVEQIGTVNLPEARCYNIVVPMYEDGGGENMEFKYRFGTAVPYAQLNFVDGSPGSTQIVRNGCSSEGFAIMNTMASDIGPSNAVLNGVLNASVSVFCVDAFWGPTNGGTNAMAWSNSAP